MKEHELTLLSSQMRDARTMLEGVASRIVSEFVTFRYPTGEAEDVLITDRFREVFDGVWMKSVDSHSTAGALIVKQANIAARVPEHSHSQAEQLWVVEGRVRVTIEGFDRILDQGESIQIAPGETHTILWLDKAVLMARLVPRFMHVQTMTEG